MTPTHVDLFSGIGGFSLAAAWAGFHTVLHCEIDPYCQKVLGKRFPDVPIHDDIKTLDGSGMGAVDLLTGGFPCQPFSGLHRGGGMDSPKNLWPEMRRVVSECRPRWVVGENVSGVIDKAMDAVCGDLETAGYEVAEPLVFQALAVGAGHGRYRTFFLAHAHDQLVQGSRDDFSVLVGTTPSRASGGGEAAILRPAPHCGVETGRHWKSQSRPLGVVDGLPRKLDRHRIAALGNAVVPQQVYPLLAAIYETMRRAA